MAKFAIGSLAFMAYTNRPNPIPNRMVPYLGSRLTVHWPFFISLVVVIPAFHLLLFCAAIHMSSGVIIIDNSYLSLARLLRPVVEELGDGGTFLGGREISEVLKKKKKVGSERVVYGPRKSGAEGEYVLGIGSDITRCGSLWKRGWHPDGKYI